MRASSGRSPQTCALAVSWGSWSCPAAVRALQPDVEVSIQPARLADGTVRRSLDPIALAGLIVAIPGAVLAVTGLADRIRKRRRAKTLIGTIKTIEVEKRVRVDLVTDQGSRALESISVDELLDLIDGSGP